MTAVFLLCKQKAREEEKEEEEHWDKSERGKKVLKSHGKLLFKDSFHVSVSFCLPCRE